MTTFKPTDDFRPFSNGSEFRHWLNLNCHRGEKGCRRYNPNAESSRHGCPIDGLDVPAEHRNLIGTRMARYCNKGWMEPTTERRKVTHAAANGRKNPVYRITRKGWQELTAGACAEGQAWISGGGGAANRPSPALSADPGEQSRPSTGVPTSEESGSDTNPAVPSASDRTGESPAVTSHAAGGSARQLQRGRDRQVRGAGNPMVRRNEAQAEAEAADDREAA